MGLDITYYSDLQPSGDPDDFTVNSFPEFSGRAEPLEDGGMYKGTVKGRFRAGTYSGYNFWREQLAKLAGYEPALSQTGKGMRHDCGAWRSEGGPFWELINFSDCEGVIGPKASAKLARDFAQFQPEADRHEDEFFRRLYAEWRKAFEAAAQNGAVDFH